MTNVIQALTSTTNTLSLFNEASLTFGLPLQVIFDSIGAPINALSALNSSAVAVAAALQSGNVGAAVAAGLGAPAAIANGFLNGTTLLSLPLVDLNPVGLNGFALVEIPFGGILTPLSRPSVFLLADGVILRPTLGGTGFGGLIPGLLSCESELAQAMALPAPTLPLLAF